MRNLFLFLILGGLAAAGVYYRGQLLTLWQDIQRVRNQPDVEKILTETRREEYGIFCSGVEMANDCYLFDKNGVVFAKAKTVVEEVILRVEEVSDYKPTINQKFLPAEDWENLFKILDFIKRGYWPASTFRFKRQRQEIILEGPPADAWSVSDWRAGPPKLLFNLRFDPSKHLAALLELKKKIKIENLSYIDLRVEDKIFYK